MNTEMELIRADYIERRGLGWYPHDARERQEEKAAEEFDTALQKYAHEVAHKAVDLVAYHLNTRTIRDGYDIGDAIDSARDEIDGREP